MSLCSTTSVLAYYKGIGYYKVAGYKKDDKQENFVQFIQNQNSDTTEDWFNWE